MDTLRIGQASHDNLAFNLLYQLSYRLSKYIQNRGFICPPLHFEPRFDFSSLNWITVWNGYQAFLRGGKPDDKRLGDDSLVVLTVMLKYTRTNCRMFSIMTLAPFLGHIWLLNVLKC